MDNKTKFKKIDQILQHITSLLSRHSDQVLLEQLGIGYAQFKIIRTVSDSPNCKQRYVSDLLGQTEASISRQIKLLLKLDYLRSDRDPLNKRNHVLNVTIRGKNIYDAGERVLERFYSDKITQIGVKNYDELIDKLRKIDTILCGNEHYPDFINYISSH